MDGTVTGMEATVICGNVQTANATVYIIDQVLKPAAADRRTGPGPSSDPRSDGGPARV